MRQAVIDTIHDYMKENKNSYFLTGDLGYATLEKIETDFPDRFINIGVAEQNMIGISAGLALSGNKVFVYSIIPFLTMRCFEQVRNDLCYHNLDVTLIGSGAGLTYGILGATHFALEDISIMRSLPNMTVFSPCDETEAILGMKYLLKHQKTPTYIRIGKRTEPVVYKKPFDLKIGKANVIQKGKDLVFFSHGSLVNEVIEAAKIIKKETELSSTIVDVHTIKPLDKETILKEAKNKKMAFTVEEHYMIGGLGSAVSEVLSQEKTSPVLKIIGVDGSDFIHNVGKQSYLRQALELDFQGIAKKVRQVPA